MARNEKGENVETADYTAATGADLVITWTANEPTAGNAQTIADGTVPTVAELGQFAQNATTIINQLVADIAALKANLA